MSSQDVARYLCEVASNERKLEYCRQILASNTNFIPSAIFNLAAPQPRTSLSRQDFVELVRSLGLASSQQEIELVFTYFQIDGKSYLTLEEFQSLITPQIDTSLKSLINYALRFALQKFFGQVVENQVRLELLCRFTFEKEEKKGRHRKVTGEGVREFLGYHGKYPSEAEVSLIMKEIGVNKGEGKRNKLIGEFVLAYNDKKRENQEVPKVYERELSAMADFRNKYQSAIENQEKAIANSRFQPSTAKQENPSKVSSPSPQRQQQARTIVKDVSNNISSVNKVQDRIKSLMDSINITGRLTTSRKQQKTESKAKEGAKSYRQSQKSGTNRSVLKKLDFKESIIADIYSLDNRSQRKDANDRSNSKQSNNKTDRLRYKRITEENLESSQVSAKPLPSEQESKKRREYLRSLIDSGQDRREGYLRKYEG